MKSKPSQKCQIKEIAEFNPENIEKHFQFSEINYIDTGSVTEGNLTTIQKIDRKYAPSRAKRLVKKNDIIISTVRPNLKHHYFVKNPQENLVVSTGFVVVRPTSVNPLYLYYFLTTPSFIEYLTGVAESHTSAYPSFPPEIIEDAEINLPDEPVQKQIGKILSDLDSQIENLQKQNKVLEKIAQAIFKSWFVDFDGVIEFQDSELGQIPKGWKTGILDIITNNLRDTINVKDIDSNIFYIGLEHMPRGRIELANWENAVDLKSNKFKFKTNQILFGKLRPYFKKVGIALIDGICSTDILVLDSKDPIWLEFLLFVVSSEDFIQYANQSSTGTRMPRADWNFMKKYPIILPTSSKISEFHQIIKNHIEMIKKNIFEIISLTKTRDILLPKLMSGEIRV